MPARPPFLCLFLLLGPIAGFIPAPGPASAAGERVVVLGSSTAAGQGPSVPDSAWVNRFRADAQLVDSSRIVTNLAVGGYTTYHILPDGSVPPDGRPEPDPDHNITRAMDLGADALIINLPSNDAASGWPVSDQLANYDVVLAVAAGHGVPVWISTTQPRNMTAIKRANLMAMRDSTLARWGEMAVDFWTEFANADGTINPIYDSGDGKHLNDAAHGILFQRVAAKDIWGALTVGIPEPTVAIAGLRVYPAAPNPFRGRTRLSWSLPDPAHVTLEIFDVSGRKVAIGTEGDFPAGRHDVLWEGENLPGGVYFYRVRTEGESATGRMVRVP